MNQLLQELKKAAEPVQVDCMDCKATVQIRKDQVHSREIPGLPGIQQVGLECPACGAFSHHSFTSPRTRRLAEKLSLVPLTHRQRREELTQEFQAETFDLQTRIQKRLRTHKRYRKAARNQARLI